MGKQIFTIAKLEDKDYLDLYKQFPNIKKEDLENSLGFTSKSSGEIYIRKTGSKDLDNATLLHEAEELVKDVSPHEENGIRYWKLKNVFKSVYNAAKDYAAPIALGLIPGVGPVLAGAYSGINNYQTSGNVGQAALTGVLSGAGSALGQGTPGYTNAVNASKASGGGIVGQSLSGGQGILQQALGSLPGFGKGGAMSGITKALTPGAVNSVGNQLGIMSNTVGQIGSDINKITAPGFNPALSSGVGAGVGAGVANTLGNTSNVSLSGGAPAGLNINSVNASAGLPSAAAAPKTFMETAKGLVTPGNVLGATSILGSMATPSPQFEMPSTVEDIRKKLIDQTEGGQGGLTELGKQAQLELGNIVKSTPSQINAPANDAYYADVNRRIDLQYEQAKNQLDAVYNNAGMLGSGEYLDQMRQLTESQANAKNAFMENENQRRFEYGANQKYQAIQTALGVDSAVMDDLVGLSGLDVQTAAMMYGAQAADITAIRQALGTLGTELILRGTTGAGKQPTINLNMG